MSARAEAGPVGLFAGDDSDAYSGDDSEAYSNVTDTVNEGSVAILAAALLFVLPIDWAKRRFTLTWNQAALAAIFGADYGFMLPVSTPPNAIVYSSGVLPITRMIQTGAIFDVIGAVSA